MTKIKCVKDLIEKIPDKPKGIDGFLFRGVVASKYKLIPKLCRKNNHSDQLVLPETAKKRLLKLREYLSIHLSAYGYDFHNMDKNIRLWRELFIAQHHGAPTTLLDFTRNPLAALYFAVNQKSKDGKLYTINIKRQEIENKEDFDSKDPNYNIASYDLIGKGPYEIQRPIFIVPPYFDKRIKLQESVFCCFPNSNLTTPLEEQLNEKDKTRMGYIRSWKIPKEKKENIQNELNNIGVNASTLFPDIQGFGEFVNWKLLNIE